MVYQSFSCIINCAHNIYYIFQIRVYAYIWPRKMNKSREKKLIDLRELFLKCRYFYIDFLTLKDFLSYNKRKNIEKSSDQLNYLLLISVIILIIHFYSAWSCIIMHFSIFFHNIPTVYPFLLLFFSSSL